MVNRDPQGLYAALGLSPDATQKDISKAYHRLNDHQYTSTGKRQSFELFNDRKQAYEILNDPQRRAEYDSLHVRMTEEDFDPDAAKPIRCGECSKITEQPRHLVFYRTFSVVYMTFKTPRQGLFCPACAKREAIASSFITSIAGWWGFPWGPLFSLQSLKTNLFGGISDQKVNDSLLLQNAHAFLAIGKRQVAYDLARLAQASKVEGIASLATSFIKRLPSKGLVKTDASKNAAWRRSMLFHFGHVASIFAVPAAFFAFVYLSPTGGGAAYDDSDITPLSSQVETGPPQSVEAYRTEFGETCQSRAGHAALLYDARPATDSHNELMVKNQTFLSMIVKLRSNDTGALLANFLVGSQKSAVLGDLPDGAYRVQYTFGSKLNPLCNSFTDASLPKALPDPQVVAAQAAVDGIHYEQIFFTVSDTSYGDPLPLIDFNRP